MYDNQTTGLSCCGFPGSSSETILHAMNAVKTFTVLGVFLEQITLIPEPNPVLFQGL